MKTQNKNKKSKEIDGLGILQSQVFKKLQDLDKLYETASKNDVSLSRSFSFIHRRKCFIEFSEMIAIVSLKFNKKKGREK